MDLNEEESYPKLTDVLAECERLRRFKGLMETLAANYSQGWGKQAADIAGEIRAALVQAKHRDSEHPKSESSPASTSLGLVWRRSEGSPPQKGNYLVRGRGNANPSHWWLEHSTEHFIEAYDGIEIAGPIPNPREPREDATTGE